MCVLKSFRKNLVQMVTSPGFPEYLYGQDGRREVLSEAYAISRLAWKCGNGRKMGDYLGHSARKISRSSRCGM